MSITTIFILIIIAIISNTTSASLLQRPTADNPIVSPHIFPIIPKVDRHEPSFIVGYFDSQHNFGLHEDIAQLLTVEGYGTDPAVLPIAIKDKHYMCVLPKHNYPHLRPLQSPVNPLSPYTHVNDRELDYAWYIQPPLLDLTPTKKYFDSKPLFPSSTTTLTPTKVDPNTPQLPPRTYKQFTTVQPSENNILFRSKEYYESFNNPQISPKSPHNRTSRSEWFTNPFSYIPTTTITPKYPIDKANRNNYVNLPLPPTFTPHWALQAIYNRPTMWPHMNNFTGTYILPHDKCTTLSTHRKDPSHFVKICSTSHLFTDDTAGLRSFSLISTFPNSLELTQTAHKTTNRDYLSLKMSAVLTTGPYAGIIYNSQDSSPLISTVTPPSTPGLPLPSVLEANLRSKHNIPNYTFKFYDNITYNATSTDLQFDRKSIPFQHLITSRTGGDARESGMNLRQYITSTKSYFELFELNSDKPTTSSKDSAAPPRIGVLYHNTYNLLNNFELHTNSVENTNQQQSFFQKLFEDMDPTSLINKEYIGNSDPITLYQMKLTRSHQVVLPHVMKLFLTQINQTLPSVVGNISVNLRNDVDIVITPQTIDLLSLSSFFNFTALHTTNTTMKTNSTVAIITKKDPSQIAYTREQLLQKHIANLVKSYSYESNEVKESFDAQYLQTHPMYRAAHALNFTGNTPLTVADILRKYDQIKQIIDENYLNQSSGFTLKLPYPSFIAENVTNYAAKQFFDGDLGKLRHNDIFFAGIGEDIEAQERLLKLVAQFLQEDENHHSLTFETSTGHKYPLNVRNSQHKLYNIDEDLADISYAFANILTRLIYLYLEPHQQFVFLQEFPHYAVRINTHNMTLSGTPPQKCEYDIVIENISTAPSTHYTSFFPQTIYHIIPQSIAQCYDIKNTVNITTILDNYASRQNDPINFTKAPYAHFVRPSWLVKLKQTMGSYHFFPAQQPQDPINQFHNNNQFQLSLTHHSNNQRQIAQSFLPNALNYDYIYDLYYNHPILLHSMTELHKSIKKPILPPPVQIPTPLNHLEAVYLVDNLFGNFFSTYDYFNYHNQSLPSTTAQLKDAQQRYTILKTTMFDFQTVPNINTLLKMPCLAYQSQEMGLYRVCPHISLQHSEAPAKEIGIAAINEPRVAQFSQHPPQTVMSYDLSRGYWQNSMGTLFPTLFPPQKSNKNVQVIRHTSDQKQSVITALAKTIDIIAVTRDEKIKLSSLSSSPPPASTTSQADSSSSSSSSAIFTPTKPIIPPTPTDQATTTDKDGIKRSFSEPPGVVSLLEDDIDIFHTNTRTPQRPHVGYNPSTVSAAKSFKHLFKYDFKKNENEQSFSKSDNSTLKTGKSAKEFPRNDIEYYFSYTMADGDVCFAKDATERFQLNKAGRLDQPRQTTYRFFCDHVEYNKLLRAKQDRTTFTHKPLQSIHPVPTQHKQHTARVLTVTETSPCVYRVDILSPAVCEFSLNQPLFNSFYSDAERSKIYAAQLTVMAESYALQAVPTITPQTPVTSDNEEEGWEVSPHGQKWSVHEVMCVPAEGKHNPYLSTPDETPSAKERMAAAIHHPINAIHNHQTTQTTSEDLLLDVLLDHTMTTTPYYDLYLNTQVLPQSMGFNAANPISTPSAPSEKNYFENNNEEQLNPLVSVPLEHSTVPLFSALPVRFSSNQHQAAHHPDPQQRAPAPQSLKSVIKQYVTLEEIINQQLLHRGN